MIDTQTGCIGLAAGLAVERGLTVAEMTDFAKRNGIKDLGLINHLRVFSIASTRFGNRPVAAVLRFAGEKLHFVELTLLDGVVAKLGYDATEKDLLNEKRQLSKMITDMTGCKPKDVSLGVDYFPFEWGLISVVADPRSSSCRIVVNYEARVPL